MTRPIINSSTFNEIFKNDPETLAMIAASLTKEDITFFKNNITCNPNNPNNVDYLINMPNDYEIKITNTKNNKIITINF